MNFKVTLMALFIYIGQNLYAADKLIVAQECSKGETSCELFKDVDKSSNIIFYGSKEKRIIITASDLISSEIKSKDSQSIINLSLNSKLSKKLKSLSEVSLGKNLLIIGDGKVISTPRVKAIIDSGNLSISLPKDQSIFSEKLKWLKALSHLKQKNQALKNRESKIYLGVTGLLFISSLAYVYSPIRKNE